MRNKGLTLKGFTLIELLIAIGLAALFLPALVYVFSFSLGAASQGENYTKAYAIAQENMEAIYYLKDTSWDWTTEPQNTINADDYYQPDNSTGTWVIGPIVHTPQKKDGYIVTVKILPVNRSAEDNITENPLEWSELDKDSRKIVVKVNWNENGQDTSIDLVSYVTKH